MPVPIAAAAATEIVWHSIRRTFSVICTIAVIGFIGWAVYALVIKPQTNPIRTTQQTAHEIKNVYVTEDREQFFFGLKIFGYGLGITKRAQKKPEIIGQFKKEVTADD